MNNGGNKNFKRAIAAVLAVTFIASLVILVWGIATPSEAVSVASEAEATIIAPVDSTQPGATEGSDQAVTTDGQSQPSQTPADSSTAANPGTSSSSGSQATPPPSTTGGGTSGGASSTPTPAPTVAPTPTPVVQACGSGGTCHLADIQSHSSAADCRSAINIGGTTSAYAITESWLTTHRDNFKTITTKLCGKVWASDLKQSISEHRDGTAFSGMVFQQWMNNFYIGPYN
jgi:hypothetical protein